MKRGFTCAGEPIRALNMDSRKQRLRVVKVFTAYLALVSDAELRSISVSTRPEEVSRWRYEAELISSIIDEAVFVLETLW
jgi:hypothetical protein